MEQIPTIRRARPDDASAIVGVLEIIAAERIHSAIDRVWSVDEERRFLEGLSDREAVHVAVDPNGTVVGLQILDRWSAFLESMAHVGQLGTFVLPAWRGRGLGMQLWQATHAFARSATYQKVVVQIRESNAAAQAFYRRLGFAECGRLRRQVMIDGVADDEVLMEMFLSPPVPVPATRP